MNPCAPDREVRNYRTLNTMQLTMATPMWCGLRKRPAAMSSV